MYDSHILTEHNIHPIHKTKMIEPQRSLRGVNPSCGDDITLQLNVSDDGVITDGAFFGDGCAISQASADIMIELIIGKTLDEAKHYAKLFRKMISGEITDDELELLEEAGALQHVSKMPARVKCALLSWNTMEKLLEENE